MSRRDASTTSPLKIGDYALSDAPIVAAKLPHFDKESITLDKTRSGIFFYEPSNFRSFNDSIDQALKLGRQSKFDRASVLNELFISYEDRLKQIAALVS